jgi:hypothetical protein
MRAFSSSDEEGDGIGSALAAERGKHSALARRTKGLVGDGKTHATMAKITGGEFGSGKHHRQLATFTGGAFGEGRHRKALKEKLKKKFVKGGSEHAFARERANAEALRAEERRRKVGSLGATAAAAKVARRSRARSPPRAARDDRSVARAQRAQADGAASARRSVSFDFGDRSDGDDDGSGAQLLAYAALTATPPFARRAASKRGGSATVRSVGAHERAALHADGATARGSGDVARASPALPVRGRTRSAELDAVSATDYRRLPLSGTADEQRFASAESRRALRPKRGTLASMAQVVAQYDRHGAAGGGTAPADSATICGTRELVAAFEACDVEGAGLVARSDFVRIANALPTNTAAGAAVNSGAHTPLFGRATFADASALALRFRARGVASPAAAGRRSPRRRGVRDVDDDRDMMAAQDAVRKRVDVGARRPEGLVYDVAGALVAFSPELTQRGRTATQRSARWGEARAARGSGARARAIRALGPDAVDYTRFVAALRSVGAQAALE